MEIKKKSDAKNYDFLTVPVEGQNMYFKIKKANDQVICISLCQPNCNKWHIVVDEKGGFDAIRCFALRKQSKCKTCWLADTIQSRIRRKTSCKVVKKLKR